MIFKYKKIFLNLVSVLSFGVTSLSAEYISLADTLGNNEQWTLFGVTSLHANGAGSGASAGSFSIADSVANTLSDTTLDELYVDGLLDGADPLAKLKVLSPYSQVEVRVDTSTAVYDANEPLHTMYVAMAKGNGPAFAFSYHSSLENKVLQYSVQADGSDAHTITISSIYTYNNPAIGQTIQRTAGAPVSYLSDLSEIVDYDFSNNPSDSSYYDQVDNQDIAGIDDYIRVYSFDSLNQQWQLYDSRNTAEANDFTTLEKGKAYWAKMNNNTIGNAGGLVVGSSSISSAEYIASGISNGWNLMAFGKQNPDIRKSETGLIITLNTGVAEAASEELRIWDTSGNHYVDVDFVDDTSTTINSSCKAINKAIEDAKINGVIPDTFDLKAFYISDTQIALISSKRFFVDELNVDMFGEVTTLTGKKPYTVDPNDLVNAIDYSTISIDFSDVTKAAMSKYGEYALIIEPLVSAGTAAGDLDVGKLHLQSAALGAPSVNPFSIDNATVGASTVASTVTAIDNRDIGGYTAFAKAIDINYDNTPDRVLISSTEPFYVRDYTFTRVFKYTDTNVAGTAYIKGTGADASISLAATDDDSVAAAIAFDGSGNVAATDDPSNSTSQFVIITDATNANEFTITETTTTDHLEDAITDSDLAKGAVKAVYSLNTFATANTKNTISFTIASADIPDEVDDALRIDIKNTMGHIYTGTGLVISGIPANAAAWAGEFKSQLESELSSSAISATVTAVVNGVDIDVSITGRDILDISYDWYAGTTNDETDLAFGAAAIDQGGLEIISPDLADDLKFNAVYSSNYVNDGPLYTMKEAGYTLKALISGSTNLASGTISWDVVDLTRSPSEWLSSQEYNLFKINETSGYWALLETDAGTNDINVSNAALLPITYAYRFNADGTNYNSVSGNIALTIDGLATNENAIPVVSTTIAGTEVELSNTTGSDIYTGKISSYEIENMQRGYSYEISANVADGLGYNVKALDIDLRIDFDKPAAPVVNLGDGTTISFTSTSTDVAGYYVFVNQIPEQNTATATNLLKNLTALEAVSYSICQDTNRLSWDEESYTLNVVAVDGSGILTQGNISDTTTQNYIPMLKGSVRLTDEHTGLSDSTTLGVIYDNYCADTGAQTVDYGITLTSETNATTVKLAYVPENVTNFAVPISLFVTDGITEAKITYTDEYVGNTVYVDLDGSVYSLILPTQNEIDTDDNAGTGPWYGAAGVGASIGNPLNLLDGIDDLPIGDQNGYAEFQTGQSL